VRNALSFDVDELEPAMRESAGLPLVDAPTHIVENTDVDTYGPAFSAATLAFGVTQMISPQIGGALADAFGSFTWVFVLSAAVSLFAACFASRLPQSAT
jgi:MFS family permease